MRNDTTDVHPDSKDLFQIEKLEDLIILRGIPQKGIATVDLEVSGKLWEFFETVARHPPKVLLLQMPDNLFCPSNLDYFWEHIGKAGSETYPSRFSSYESDSIACDLSRVEYGAARFAEYVQSLDSLVLISLHGRIAYPFLGLILACDFRICSDDTRFINDCIDGSSLPVGGLSYFLTRHLGLSKAKELLFNTEHIEAQKAKGLGLINLVVPSSSIEERSLACALEFVGKPCSGLLTMKRTLNVADDHLNQYIEQELKALKWGMLAWSTEIESN